MPTGSIPTRRGGSEVLIPYYKTFVTDFMVFIGMNRTAFLDSLSYKKSSKYSICILGMSGTLNFLTGTYNPAPYPPHFGVAFAGFMLQITCHLVSEEHRPQSYLISALRRIC